MAMTIPLMYYLYRESKHFYIRWGLIGAMFLTAVAAFGTHSRGVAPQAARSAGCAG